VSAWEISVKHALGKLPLPRPPRVLVPEQRTLHGIERLALDEESALLEATLPPLHTDPFDRMLICQALSQGLTLLTPDPQIARYPVLVAW